MARPALSVREKEFRNPLERGAAQQMTAAGVTFEYEGTKLPFQVPSRTATYLPDFRIGDIIIETKGWFGRQSAKERQKLILVKEQHPELDIRIVFGRASNRIYSGSPTTYADWAQAHGFAWSDKGIIPQSWITDLKKEMQRCNTRSK